MKEVWLATQRFAAIAWMACGAIAVAQPGQLDPTFQTGAGFDGLVFSAALRRDGKIVTAGTFHSFDGENRHSYARLDSSGRLDPSFEPPDIFGDYNYAVAIDRFDRIVGSSSAQSTTHMTRFLEDGTPDPSFNAPGRGAYWIGINASNEVFVTGGRMVKLLPDGTLDYSFNIGHRYNSDGGIFAGALKTNGHVVMGGQFYYVGDQFRAHIAEVDRFGRLITNGFTEGVDGFVIGVLCLQPDQKVIAGGDFEGSIIRYTEDGQVDASFAPSYIADWDGWPGYVEAIGLQPDGKILIGGVFVSIGGVAITNIARLLPDGSLDSTFDAGVGPNNQIRGIFVQPDGRSVVVGDFTTFNGVPAGHIVRLLGDKPVLNAQASPTGELILKWPVAYTNYVLQTSSNLLSTNWFTLTNSPIVTSNLCVVSNSITGANQFFRLTKREPKSRK
jgi:uncharacterized delta-60 repeat protein